MKNEAIIFTRDIEVSRVEKIKIYSEDLQKNYEMSSNWMIKHFKIHLAMCTQKATVSWAASQEVTRELREGILPFCSHETSPRVLHPALKSPAREEQRPVVVNPEETMKVMKGH